MNTPMTTMLKKQLLHSLLLGSLCLTACSFGDKNEDSAPARTLNPDDIKDAVPKAEPISKQGNPNWYERNGTRYEVLKSSDNFTERGMASWYGQKYHGLLTSNGETYDMYAMTAAHPTLPIPTYVEVTNLKNKRTIVVRINDRGPFAKNRVIDLSYAAAVKLDMHYEGVAEVNVVAIDPQTWQPKAKNQTAQARKPYADLDIESDADDAEAVAAKPTQRAQARATNGKQPQVIKPNYKRPNSAGTATAQTSQRPSNNTAPQTSGKARVIKPNFKVPTASGTTAASKPTRQVVKPSYQQAKPTPATSQGQARRVIKPNFKLPNQAPARASSRSQQARPSKNASYVQIASYAGIKSATRAKQKFAKELGEPMQIMKAQVKGKLIFRLRAGPYSSGEIKPALNKIKKLGRKDAFIVRE